MWLLFRGILTNSKGKNSWPPVKLVKRSEILKLYVDNKRMKGKTEKQIKLHFCRELRAGEHEKKKQKKYIFCMSTLVR